MNYTTQEVFNKYLKDNSNNDFNINHFVKYYLTISEPCIKLKYKDFGLPQNFKRENYIQRAANEIIYCETYKKNLDLESYYSENDNGKKSLNTLESILEFYQNTFGKNNTNLFTKNIEQERHFWNLVLCINGIKEGYINHNDPMTEIYDYSEVYKTNAGKLINVKYKKFEAADPMYIYTSEKNLNMTLGSNEAKVLDINIESEYCILDKSKSTFILNNLLGYPCKNKPSSNFIKMNAYIKFNDKYNQLFKSSITELILFSFLIPENVYSVRSSENDLIKSGIYTKTLSFNGFFKNTLDIGQFCFTPE